MMEDYVIWKSKFYREVYRYRAVLLRQRFEENRNVTDMAKAAKLLAAGEQELFNTQHYQPIKRKLRRAKT